ncbi:aspartic peptidase domain-containing protein [Xylariomycetidae sp. FL2044]|nr:aspartic peptidase domain-containing protein [Xylariomycetidae sp. FL2044]
MKTNCATLMVLSLALVLEGAIGQILLDLERVREARNSITSRDLQGIDLQFPTGSDLYTSDDFYRTSIKVGTPARPITCAVIMSSLVDMYANVRLPSSDSNMCLNTTSPYGGCRLGSYNQNLSSTFSPTGSTFNISDDSQGILFNDTVEIGGVSVTDVTMALVYEVALIDYYDSPPFISLLNIHNKSTPSIIDLMVTQGGLSTRAYSFWLQEQDDYAGQLLLGAVDRNRFTGSLLSLDAYTKDDQVWTDGGIRIHMTSVVASSSTGSDDLQSVGVVPVAVTDRTAMMLPQPIATQIYALLGAIYVEKELSNTTLTFWLVPCSMRDSKGVFTFGFGGSEGINIEVSMRSLISPPTIINQDEWQNFNDSGEDMCNLLVYPAGSPRTYAIGAPLLRFMYTVVDLHNRKVAMAPVNLDAKEEESDVITFNGYGAPIPAATLVQNQPTPLTTTVFESLRDYSTGTITVDKTFNAAEGFKILSTSSTTPSITGRPGKEEVQYLSTGAKAGIGIGVTLAVILGVVAGFLALKRRRRGRASASRPMPDQSGGFEKPELSAEPGQNSHDTTGRPIHELSHLNSVFEFPNPANPPNEGKATESHQGYENNHEAVELSAEPRPLERG